MKLEQKSKCILGIDPGSIKAGYALIKIEGKKIEILESGVLKLNAKNDFFLRLRNLKKELEALSASWPLYELALESLIHVKNVNSLAKLSQARGVMISVLAEKAVSISEYAPNLVKSSVSGYGLSSKDSVEKALQFLFPKKQFLTDDESDALAVALCHSLQGGVKKAQNSKRSSASSMKAAFKHLEG